MKGYIMSKVLVRNPFLLDADAHSLASALECKDPSLTVQSDKDQADINNIVKQFGLTGGLPYGEHEPIYDDFTQFPYDYHEAMNAIRDADDAFMQLPAQLRTRFANDAGQFLDFIGDAGNYDEAVSLGLLLPKDAVPEPVPTKESPPAAPKAD